MQSVSMNVAISLFIRLGHVEGGWGQKDGTMLCLFVCFSPLLARYECSLFLQSLRIACFLGKISLLSRSSFCCWSFTCKSLAKFVFFGPFS
jgi:hypothetical protein